MELAAARSGPAGPLHPRRRGHGADPRARRVRPQRGLQSDRAVAARGTASRKVRHLGEPLGPPARGRRDQPNGQGRAPGRRPAGGVPRPRGDRDESRRGGARRQPGAGGAPAAPRRRRADRDRRLRHRLLVARTAAQLPGGHDQGRPFVRAGRRRRDQGRRDHCESGHASPMRSESSRSPRESSPTASSRRCAASAATWRKVFCSLARCPRTTSGTSSRAASAT